MAMHRIVALMAAVLVDAGIKNFTWHCLRHTFASRLVMAGVDLRTVAELMGHKNLQMMRYARLAPEHKAAAVDKLVKTATDTKTDTKRVKFGMAEHRRIMVD